MIQASVKIKKAVFSNNAPLVYITGPCVMESLKAYAAQALKLKAMFGKLGTSFVLKASFDKANRTSHSSFRGIPIETALNFLKDLKNRLDVPVLIDVHEPSQAARVAQVADILQIPAFLCRQTDLLFACADTGRAVNIKKGQFLAPWDMGNIISKIESRGNKNILLTERGTSFGYNNLVVDMRGMEIMKEFGYPVIFDCTHSVQKPGALGKTTGGDAKLALPLAKAAAALKIAGVFFEAHPAPALALSDGPNSLKLRLVPEAVKMLNQIDRLAMKLKNNKALKGYES
jgi:2-dehydro-3-deoxyphosphooctonate aldolase (KDO 8-P synthase)